MTTTRTPQPTERLTFRIDYDRREANARRPVKDAVDDCFICGRGLTEKALARGFWIHLSTDGTLIPEVAGWDADDSQGAFPVGSECAKQVPRPYRFHIKTGTLG